ncbi:PAS domain S-box protein [Halobellus sp. Atlit-38R]|uniref:sensor histidine kinase n=1 Tax=Halobellus sp. Atlit-38R TaxID=2282131 RepID=UPI000EF1BF94|nr:ATP-binding protein [Halobellus sp. Atlit-38R]RLM83732.1 PAS domain S-box protein [Halobellus sp. Atlit-38R]
MSRRRITARHLWAGAISGLGTVSFLAHIPHLLAEDELLAYVLGVFVPMSLSFGLIVLGYQVYQSALNTDQLPRVTGWTITGMVGMVFVSAVIYLYQYVEGNVMSHGQFVVLNLFTAGGIAGALIGVYDGRQRQEKHATEQARRRYQMLLDASPDAVFVASTDTGEIVDVNRTAEELLGRQRDELIGMHQSELHPEENRGQYRDLFATHTDTEEALSKLPDGSDAFVNTAGGNRIPVEINAAKFDYRDQSLLLGVFRDVSNQRNKEKQLQNRSEQLEILNQVVRHDIRNEMSVVTGWIDILAKYVDDEGTDVLERVRHASQRVINLTEEARDYVEVVTEETTLDLYPISLNCVLREEIATRREQYPNAAFNISGDVPDVEVQANEMLSSTFRNLLNNAIKHNNSETPSIDIEVKQTEESVTVSIADNGPGIPDKQKEAVFGKGKKGFESSGTGIGLYVVNNLVDEFGGEVWIKDNEPTGSVAKVKLQRA